jgi:peptidoglycan/xylan/chitin deacetylase (PgdA/CDA1 family)
VPRTAAESIPYRLRSGDTLRRIAAFAEVTLEEILKLNQLEDSDIIYGGQIIHLPPGSLLPQYWPKPTPRPLPTFTTDQPPEESPVIYLGSEDRRRVALTFDVGYYPNTASQVAKELTKHDIKATFFVIGFTAQTYPQMVRDIVAYGHELGNHSWSHSDMRHLADQEIRDELQKTEKLIRQISPQSTTKPFFRAPFGYTNSALIRTAQEQGYYVVDWTIDGLDWIEDITAQEIHWTVSRALRPGAIICLHGSSTATVKALPMIVNSLKDEGYTAVTLSELLAPQ